MIKYMIYHTLSLSYTNEMMFPFLHSTRATYQPPNHGDIMRISPTIMGCGFVQKLNACDVVNYFNGENDEK
jgi:hypothetical protein